MVMAARGRRLQMRLTHTDSQAYPDAQTGPTFPRGDFKIDF